MTSEQLIQRLRENLDKTLKTCEQKTKEYAKGDDPFMTIRRLARVHEVSPSKMCMILASKHFLSMLYDIDTLTLAQTRDKINDIHNYIEYAEVLKDE